MTLQKLVRIIHKILKNCDTIYISLALLSQSPYKDINFTGFCHLKHIVFALRIQSFYYYFVFIIIQMAVPGT